MIQPVCVHWAQYCVHAWHVELYNSVWPIPHDKHKLGAFIAQERQFYWQGMQSDWVGFEKEKSVYPGRHNVHIYWLLHDIQLSGQFWIQFDPV